MHKCPFAGCAATILDTHFVCWPHWNGLNPWQKKRLELARIRFRRGQLAPEDMVRVVAEIVAEAEKDLAGRPRPKGEAG